MTAPVLDRRQRRQQRRRGTVLLATTVIAAVVAVGTVAAAFVVRADTDDLRSRAEPLRAHVQALRASEHDAEQKVAAARDGSETTNRALTDLFAAFAAQVDASNHAVDVANQAVDQYNSAQTADVAAAFQNAGDAALADLQAKTDAVRAAADAVRRGIASLQGVDG